MDDLDGPVAGKGLWVGGKSGCVPSVVSWVLTIQVGWHLCEGPLHARESQRPTE